MVEKIKTTLEVQRTGGRRVRYDLSYRKEMTILDALIEVREKQDSSLGFRHSCRMGVCGSCGMNIQGIPRLACQTRVSTLKSGVIRVEPLHSMSVLKDLVVDLEPFFAMHRSVRPYIIRRDTGEQNRADREYRVLPGEVRSFLQFDYCISCGLCFSACPTVALDPFYLGPQAIAQSYRYMADPRDEGWDQRVEMLDRPHGIWRCHAAGACSFVCPKDVDPTKAIQFARREVLKKRLLRKKGRIGSQLVPAAGAPKQGVRPPPFDFAQEAER